MSDGAAAGRKELVHRWRKEEGLVVGCRRGRGSRGRRYQLLCDDELAAAKAEGGD